MAHNSLPPEERAARRQARLDARYARERQARAAKAVAEGRSVGKTGPLPMDPAERAARQCESDRQSYTRHAEERKAKARAKDAERRAARAAAEGREVRKPGRPKVERTPEEVREMRRIKTALWREENLDRSREITRESEKRRAAARAVAEGRVPGKKGPVKKFTDEELAAKRLALTNKNYRENIESRREYAARRAREIRAEKKAGTYVSKAKSKLTAEEKRQAQVRSSQARRARLLAAIGGGYTAEHDAPPPRKFVQPVRLRIKRSERDPRPRSAVGPWRRAQHGKFSASLWAV